MAERDDRSIREQGRRRVTAASAGLLAAGVTGTVALAGYTAWAQNTDTGSSTAGTATGPGQGATAGSVPFQGSQGGLDQGQPGQQGGGFPQLGGSGGPGQAGSAGS